jgi:hypothetical protein
VVRHGRGQYLVGQFGRGEPVRAQQERPARLTGSGGDGRIHMAQGPLASLRMAGDEPAGVEPLPEHAGVGCQEDVQDLLPRAGQAAEDLGPVGVADQRHRDDQRVGVVPAQRQRRRDDELAPARQMLEIVVGPHPLPQHEADVLGVVHHRVREPPVQFLRQRRLPRSESAVKPDNHRHKVSRLSFVRSRRRGTAAALLTGREPSPWSMGAALP